MRGPDPTEFEPEFAIGDDDSSSRSGTPRPESSGAPENTQGENAEQSEGPGENAMNEKEGAPEAESAPTTPELPPDVKAKLRRLAKMESRYQGRSFVSY